MFGLFGNKSKKVKSPFREWAHNRAKQIDNSNLKDSFLISNFLAISLFNDEVIKDKNDFRNRLTGDSTLFEVGAFILFHIDYRLFVKDEMRRDIIMKLVMPDFLETFNKFLNCRQIDHILQSRLDMYGQAIRENNKQYFPVALDYLSEFIYRTRDNMQPEIIKQADYLVTNFNMMEAGIVQIVVSTYMNNFLPIVYEKTDMLVEILRNKK